MEAYCFQAYADALEVIPTTLAENAGLNPIAIVTELRNRHALGERNAGINVRKVCLHSVPRSAWMEFDPFFGFIGPYLEYIRRRCRAASFGVNQCDRALNRDGLPVAQN